MQTLSFKTAYHRPHAVERPPSFTFRAGTSGLVALGGVVSRVGPLHMLATMALKATQHLQRPEPRVALQVQGHEPLDEPRHLHGRRPDHGRVRIGDRTEVGSDEETEQAGRLGGHRIHRCGPFGTPVAHEPSGS